MSDTYRVRLHDAQQGHVAISAAFRAVKPHLIAGRAYDLTIKPETRRTAQNRMMWACLTDISEQVKWFGKRMTKEGWKDFITAHLNGTELVPNMDGTGFVAISAGRSTSDMTIAEMTAVIDLALSFGAEQGVRFSAPEYESEPACT